MIYIVTGHPRSGTSMMMAALQAGGLDVVSSAGRNDRIHNLDDHLYRMNPGDVYEPDQREMMRPDWPRYEDDKAIKVIAGWLGCLAVHEYAVCMMRRHPEEIRQSCAAALNWRTSCERVELVIREARRTLRNRRDVVQFVELEYDDVLSSPVHSLHSLASLGWPIDVERAAAVVDPSQKRFHLPGLLVGFGA